jgi:hypothetical protein
VPSIRPGVLSSSPRVWQTKPNRVRSPSRPLPARVLVVPLRHRPPCAAARLLQTRAQPRRACRHRRRCVRRSHRLHRCAPSCRFHPEWMLRHRAGTLPRRLRPARVSRYRAHHRCRCVLLRCSRSGPECYPPYRSRTRAPRRSRTRAPHPSRLLLRQRDRTPSRQRRASWTPPPLRRRCSTPRRWCGLTCR